jgi:hypothetical protein
MRIRLLRVPLAAIVTVVALAIITGSASATAPSGTTTELVARATLTGGYKAHVDGIKVKIKGPVDVAVVHVTFPARRHARLAFTSWRHVRHGEERHRDPR